MSMSGSLRNLSIRSKIIAAFSSLVVVILVLGVISIERFATLNGSVEEITNNYLLAIGYLAGMQSAIQNYRLELTKGVLIKTSGGNIDALDKSLAQWTATLAAQEAKYAPTVATDEERRLYADYQAAWRTYADGTKQVAAATHAGRLDIAMTQMGAMSAAGQRVEAALDADMQFNVASASRWAGRAAGQYSDGRLVVVLLLGAALVLALSAGYLLVREIAWPVQAMTAAMRRLATKDVAVEIPARNRSDEIGQMASAVEVFRDSMVRADQLAVAEKAEQTAKERRVTRLEGLVAAFENKIGALAGALSSASTEMEATATSMSSTASKANQQASNVAVAAEQASAGVQTVAAAAEELASSIGEINRQVAQSASVTSKAVNDAQQTDGIVRALATDAERIGQVVELISSIAGQTNLLASIPYITNNISKLVGVYANNTHVVPIISRAYPRTTEDRTGQTPPAWWLEQRASPVQSL